MKGVFGEPLPCAPEPNHHQWTGGWIAAPKNGSFRVHDDAKKLFPGLEAAWGPETPGAEIKVLGDDDYRRLLARFGSPAGIDQPPPDAFSLEVSGGGVRAAARSKEGILNAMHRLNLLAALGAGRRPGHLPNCIMLDYPAYPVRAVRVILLRRSDVPRMEPIARACAALGYNSLRVTTEETGPLDAEGDAILEGLGSLVSLRVTLDEPLPANVAADLDGPSTLDWEHAAWRGTRGACVTYRGELDVDAMAGQGFLYNLAYSAAMLWNRDYNNFSWEKVAPATEEFLPYLVGMMRQKTAGWEGPGELDAYPLLARPVDLRPGASRDLVRGVDASADALVFRHALPASPRAAPDPDGGALVGAYVVRYGNGGEERVGLVENRTVGRSDVWCGRRYDPLLSRFQTDPRLRSLSCFTRLRRNAGPAGDLELIFEHEWRNPHPLRLIDSILWKPAPAWGEAGPHVEQVTLIGKRGWDRPPRQGRKEGR